jgi:hypothetical protein
MGEGEGRITRWADYYAPTDWLCAAVPGHEGVFKQNQSLELAFEAPLRQRLTGQTHLLYFRDPRVLTELACA